MKTIGILTTYFAPNFGAMLQPFALKRTLEQKGYDVELIRYKQQAIYDGYNPFSCKRIFSKGLAAGISNILALPLFLIQSCLLKRFMRKHLQPKSSFEKTIPEKDFYFMGSDQIWNPVNTNGFDDVYFGKFKAPSHAKKIAYAASAENIQYTEDECRYLTENLANFDAISVREQSLCDNLQKFTNKKIEVVLDPTLLANPNIYNELEQKELGFGKYIFFYHIRGCNEYLDVANEYAKSINAKLYIVSASPKKELVLYALKNKNVIYDVSAGMEVFLGGIKNAECVFTPSFHGTVFSILFHRPFYSLVLNDNMNTRTGHLLNVLGLSERLLNKKLIENHEDIDYARVDAELEKLRQSSMAFIDNALNL